MKRLVILAILATMVLGMAGTASAVDLEAKGQFQFQANIMDNSDFLSAKHSGSQEDDLNFWFRARTQFRFIANENLMSELFVEYRTRLGDSNNYASSVLENGNDNSNGARNLNIKRVFLQYRFPDTEVLTTAGIFSINLPGAAAGNMVLGDLDAGALTVSSPITDQISVAVGYVRAYDANSTDDNTFGKKIFGNAANNQDDELDLFYAALPVTIDGFEATPYVMYGNIGQKTFSAVASMPGLTAPNAVAFNKDADAWWAGTSFAMTAFDPIVLKADFVYGSVDANQRQNDREGWGMDASLAYTGLDFVQPKLVFAYTSGEDDKLDNGSERLPVVNNDWAFGSYYYGDSALTKSDLDSNQQVGQMTVGLSFEGISFLDKLTHDLHFLYIKGTNDADLIKNNPAGLTNISPNGQFLTDKDQAWEVDFNTNYQIYDELAAIVEFGYIGMDLDKDTWSGYTDTNGNNRLDGKDDAAFKLAVGLVYAF
ncbi:outer membrane homotrimeric porin [Desulfovibrio sp. UCD-KL4C]|uniref:outer membrane homotrimeric porin n=1 Tax=Desulfovibrio sp. UCD-KL4C TaxID=2578120 RepID=UPI0025BCEDAB|nr:outer membrane homotrimeric porin [Desulfovibrio sp. UCD-KL4C]